MPATQKKETAKQTTRSRKMNIRRAAVAAVCTMISAASFASSPHFVRGPTASITSSGEYVVSFKEVGLNSQPITYSIIASDAEFTYQCFNPSGNTPSGEPNGIKESDVASFTTITPRNGQITGSVSLSPTSGNAQCQGRSMKLCLVAVSYSGVQFMDQTTPVGPFNMPSLSVTLSKPDCDG